MSSPSPNPVFVAHPLCPPHLRGLVEETVQAFDNSWLLSPAEGEVFEPGKACLARLQGYALHKGFTVVTITSNVKRVRFGCIGRGDESKNWCELEKHVLDMAEILQEDLENLQSLLHQKRIPQ
jgi:hypothetical protein